MVAALALLGGLGSYFEFAAFGHRAVVARLRDLLAPDGAEDDVQHRHLDQAEGERRNAELLLQRVGVGET